MDFRLSPVNSHTHRRKNRKWKQIIDESIDILSTKELNITNFKSELNVSYPIIKEVIQLLEYRGLIETREKLSRAHRLCTYYYIPQSRARR